MSWNEELELLCYCNWFYSSCTTVCIGKKANNYSKGRFGQHGSLLRFWVATDGHPVWTCFLKGGIISQLLMLLINDWQTQPRGKQSVWLVVGGSWDQETCGLLALAPYQPIPETWGHGGSRGHCEIPLYSWEEQHLDGKEDSFILRRKKSIFSRQNNLFPLQME